MLMKQLVKNFNVNVVKDNNIDYNDIHNIKVIIDRRDYGTYDFIRHVKPCVLVIEREYVDELEYACEGVNKVIMIGPEVKYIGRDAFGGNICSLIVINNDNKDVINRIFEDITVCEHTKIVVVSNRTYEGVKNILIKEAEKDDSWHEYMLTLDAIISKLTK